MKKTVRHRKRKVAEGNRLDVDKRMRMMEANEAGNEVQLTPEISAHIEFLKNACSNTDKQAILEKMTLTYVYRKSLGAKTLTVFPRFLDSPYLVRDFYNNFYYMNKAVPNTFYLLSSCQLKLFFYFLLV